MSNAITERIAEQRINFSDYQWEGGYKELYNSVESYEDLRDLILKDHTDVVRIPGFSTCLPGLDHGTNIKIFAMFHIVPVLVDLLTEQQKQELSGVLRQQLSNDRMCDIGGSTLYADDEDATTVSQSARFALKGLGALLE